jgi:small subunit ribosomal protein S1
MTDPEDTTEENEDFAAMFEASEQRAEAAGSGPAVGDVVSGTVVSISADAVFVDLGGKSEGMLEIDQVTDRDGELLVSVGDTVRAQVVDSGERSGVIVLRRTLGKGPEASRELALAYEHGIPVEGLVAAVNKGGFDVQVAGVRAFCPISQMDTRYVERPEDYVGQRLSFRITRYEAGHRGSANVVLSRRALLEEELAEQAAETRKRLEVGAVLRGTVCSIERYGAFVDLGGIEGMLHVSELSHSRVQHPSDVVSVDQEVEVEVLRIETTDNPRRPEKISLSLKSLAPDPWDEVASRLTVGEQLTGTVVRIENFGAFVEIAPGLEGLVHVSEMGGGERISSPRKVVDVGQKVAVTVMSIDVERRRIALSMDRAAREAAAADEREAVAAHGSSKESLGTFADLLEKARKK